MSFSFSYLSKNQQFNKRYNLYYQNFFFNNKNYFYICVENINFNTKEQLKIFNKIKHLVEFCKIKKKKFLIFYLL